MDDLISRAAAIETAIDAVDDWDGGYNPNREEVIRKYFESMPAVDAAPVVHGRWIHCKGKSHIWYCSNCGGKVNYNNAHKVYTKNMKLIEEVNRFCRNCGAKMNGERRESE